MSNIPHETAEQLSAFMDGELPDAEARFLLRRLEHDAELRAAWERMQLASQCLRSQAWRPMPADFSERVAAEIARAPAGNKHGWMRWAIAASVLALGLVMAPRMLNTQSETPAPATLASAPAASAAASEHIVPSPSSADLVAVREAAPATPAAAEATSGEDAPLVASVEPSHRASPLPLDATASMQSPTDFPLVDAGGQRSWPRSEIVSASSDPSIEAYLVRHNQMIAEDGLGGFVPYVDVVANQQPAASSENTDATPAQDESAENDGK